MHLDKVCLLAVGDRDPHRYGEGSAGERHPFRQQPAEDVAGDILRPGGIAAWSKDQELIAKSRALIAGLQACADRLGGPRQYGIAVV